MKRALTAALAAALALTIAPAVITPANAAVFDDQIQILGPVSPTAPNGADHPPGAALGNRFFFAGSGTGTGDELWVTDGTRRGTHLVRDILPGIDNSAPKGFTTFKGRVWFQATGVGGAELWVTDGTTAGTKRVRDLYPGAGNGNPAELTVAGDTLYFTAVTEGAGRELWATDGTALRTRMVKDIWPGLTSSSPSGLTAYGDRIAFSAQITAEWDTPFVSDGTGARTYRLDAADKQLFVYNEEFAVLGNVLLMSAGDDGPIGTEVFRSRGAPGDATLVKDIELGDNAYPIELTTIGNAVVFSATNETAGYELWRTDGTAAGTNRVKDIWPGTNDSDPSSFQRSGDAVFFAASTPAEGTELWITRGTTQSTQLVRDIAAEQEGSDPYPITGLGGRAVVGAYRPSTGDELFTSNGTANGTRLIGELVPGPEDADPTYLGRARGTAFFRVELGDEVRLAAYTFPVPTVRGTPRSSYSKATAARRQVRVRVGVQAPGIGVSGRVLLYRGEKVVGSALIANGAARVRITVPLAVGRHLLRPVFVGSIDAQARVGPAFAVRVR